jgi:hypothetical protein
MFDVRPVHLPLFGSSVHAGSLNHRTRASSSLTISQGGIMSSSLEFFSSSSGMPKRAPASSTLSDRAFEGQAWAGTCWFPGRMRVMMLGCRLVGWVGLGGWPVAALAGGLGD